MTRNNLSIFLDERFYGLVDRKRWLAGTLSLTMLADPQRGEECAVFHQRTRLALPIWTIVEHLTIVLRYVSPPQCAASRGSSGKQNEARRLMTLVRDFVGEPSIRDIVVRKTTAAQQVADGLSDLILSGKVTPGQRFRESAMAAELRVARNTIREAIRLLEIAGLVRVEVNRGVVAISPTPESLKSLYSARLVLETSAVGQRRSKDRIQHVRRAYDRLIESSKSQVVSVIVRDDLAFHAAIVAMLESPRIDQFFNQLARELRFYLVYLCVQDSEFLQSAKVVDEHYPIVNAIEAGSIKLAREEVEKHIINNHRRVRELIFKNLGGMTSSGDVLSW